MEREFPNLTFQSVDIDQNEELADQFQISSLPTIVFLFRGKEIDRVVGADSKSIAQAAARLARKK